MTLFLTKTDPKTGPFLDPFFDFFQNLDLSIMKPLYDEANEIPILWSLTPQNWRTQKKIENQVEKKNLEHPIYQILKNFFFTVSIFHFFFLKNRLFSNFVLISVLFQKIEKNEDIRTKLSQNRRKNHEKVGYTLSLLSKIVHFWRFCPLLNSFLRCFCQLCPYICVFLFFVFSTFSWVFNEFLEERMVNKMIVNSWKTWIFKISKLSDN